MRRTARGTGRIRVPLGSIAPALLLALAACNAGPANDAEGAAAENSTAIPAGSVEVRISTADGQTHRFIAEVALDKEAQQQGLMGRTSLADDAGMLFPFAFPNMASFWMKETNVPLDLLFIRNDGTIVDILPGEPGSLRPIAANEPVTAVLEIRQGRAEALGIAKGDRIEWGACDREPAPAPDVWQADRFCPAR